jgi:MFS family permease
MQPETATPQKIGARVILGDRAVRSVTILVGIFMMGQGIVLPILPLYARSFGVGYSGAGIFVAAFGFARLFGDLLAGSIVDRKGEKWSVSAGAAFLTCCAIATGLAPSYGVAIVAWALAGIGSAVISGGMFSYIIKVAHPDRVARTFAFFFGAFNIGFVAGGFIGGVVADVFTLATPLFIYAGVLISIIVLYRIVVPDVPEQSTEVAEGDEAPGALPDVSTLRQFLKRRGFVLALMLNFTYLWMVAAVFNTLFSLFATDELRLSTSGVGIVLAIAVIAEFFVLFPAGAWSDRFGRRAVLIPSIIGLIVMVAIMGFMPNAIWFGVAAAVLGLFSGFVGVPPAAVLSDSVPAKYAGRAVGGFRFAGDLGFFLGPLVAGYATQYYGFKWAFFLSALPMFVGLVMTLTTPETMKKPVPA